MSSYLAAIIWDNDNDNNKFYLRDVMQAYVEIISELNRDFYIWPLYKQISLLVVSSDSIVKATKSLHNMPKATTMLFAPYHLHYKEKRMMTEFVYKLFFLQLPPNLIDSAHDSSLFWSLQKLLSLPSISSDSVIKFVLKHPYYKDKLNGNRTRTFVCAADYHYFGYSLDSLSNLSTTFFLAHNSGICTIELDIIT